jgi:hypothetical protein
MKGHEGPLFQNALIPPEREKNILKSREKGTTSPHTMQGRRGAAPRTGAAMGSMGARLSVACCVAIMMAQSVTAFAPHHRTFAEWIQSRGVIPGPSKCHQNSHSSNSLYNHLGKISHKHVSASSLRQKYTLKVRCAATLTAENYLSDKDVDVILREEGPGSMRPNPLVPAERYTAKDWFKSLLTIPSAVEFKRTLGFLFANAICATMIWVASIMMPGPILQITTIGLMPHLVVGGVLGLLLVLRTSAAYDRFWEARTMWSFLYSRTREVYFSHCLSI